jgi:hypothetical protein
VSRRRLKRPSGPEFDLQTSVVGANPDWPIEGKGIWTYRTFPNKGVVDEDLHLVCVHFRAKSVRVAETQSGNRYAAARLDVPVSAIAALGAGVLSGVALNRDHELRFRFDASHRINEVASVLRAQLEAKLAAQFAGPERCFVSR